LRLGLVQDGAIILDEKMQDIMPGLLHQSVDITFLDMLHVTFVPDELDGVHIGHLVIDVPTIVTLHSTGRV
jgi:hypothetical protein